MLKIHRAAGREITVTAVHPAARFGEMVLDGDTVTEFAEKVSRGSGYINGGFMVMKRGFLSEYLSSDRDEFLEQEPMRRCVTDRQTNAFRHEGFWQCMDTPREFTLLNELWSQKKVPWTRYWGK